MNDQQSKKLQNENIFLKSCNAFAISVDKEEH